MLNNMRTIPIFGPDVRQKISDPPRGMSAPIDERRITRHKIAVKPDSRSCQQYDVADDEGFLTLRSLVGTPHHI